MVKSAIAHDILVFGRSSDPAKDGHRQISEMGKRRVDAAFDYIQKHQSEFTRQVRVQFSCGWAAGEGMKKPHYKDREAVLMDKYADEKGYKKIPNVITKVQANSYSTISDAIFSAQSRFFGHRPFEYTVSDPLGIVAQSSSQLGAAKISGHMVRCLLAARKAFHIIDDALLPIVASGEDRPRSAYNEQQALRFTKIFYFGSVSDTDLLWRDRILLKFAHRRKFIHLFSRQFHSFK